MQVVTPARVQELAPMDFNTDDNGLVLVTQINAEGRVKGYRVLSGQGSPELMQRLDRMIYFSIFNRPPCSASQRMGRWFCPCGESRSEGSPFAFDSNPSFASPALDRDHSVPVRELPAATAADAALLRMWCLIAAFLAVLIAPAPARAQSAGNVLLESNEQLFCVLAALNAAGYDAGMGSGAAGDTRRMVREYLQAQNAPVLPELKKFYDRASGQR